MKTTLATLALAALAVSGTQAEFLSKTWTEIIPPRTPELHPSAGCFESAHQFVQKECERICDPGTFKPQFFATYTENESVQKQDEGESVSRQDCLGQCFWQVDHIKRSFQDPLCGAMCDLTHMEEETVINNAQSSCHELMPVPTNSPQIAEVALTPPTFNGPACYENGLMALGVECKKKCPAYKERVHSRTTGSVETSVFTGEASIDACLGLCQFSIESVKVAFNSPACGVECNHLTYDEEREIQRRAKDTCYPF
eukprot:GHVN01029351.1.p1 GENE.GHVN01029351.1~~GHVN01029351.1.p1  ORF type:complete len:255 (+),score=30.03 GHVN01029351.1:199-963(+)